jgi:hypothetical protein
LLVQEKIVGFLNDETGCFGADSVVFISVCHKKRRSWSPRGAELSWDCINVL